MRISSSNVIDGAAGYEMSPSDVGLSFLPLAHVYERTIDYAFFLNGVPIAYVEQMETVQQALLEVHPTFLGAVPRFYEKIYANVIEQGHHETGIKRKVFDWAIRVAGKSVPWRAYGKRASSFVKLQWDIADKIVYSKIRAGVGGRIRLVYRWRRAAGAGARGIFLERRLARISGLRPDGNFADRDREFAEIEQDRHGGPADSECAGSHRGRWRDSRERAVRDAGLLP